MSPNRTQQFSVVLNRQPRFFADSLINQRTLIRNKCPPAWRTACHGQKVLEGKLCRSDFYPCGSGQRIQEILGDQPELVEKKMFGGVGFIVHGNMACGVNKENLIVRVGPERYSTALSRPYTRLFDLTGRPMTGWVVVEPPGFESDDALETWVQEGVDFALSLPPK